MSRNHKKRAETKQRNALHSTLADHRQTGTLLTPPFAKVPNLSLSSWRNNRLPEMLWAVLLVANLPRAEALDVFRELAIYLHQLPDNMTTEPIDISHSGLSELDEEVLDGALRVIARTQERRESLSPIMLLDEVPAKTQWASFLETPPVERWNVLMQAVAMTLDHQSQESTDCRWARVICLMAIGRLHLPTEEALEEIRLYPDYGDQRKVRPTIRATELAFANLGEKQRSWSSSFWRQCLSDTPCFPLLDTDTNLAPVIGSTPRIVDGVHSALVGYCNQTTTTTETEAKHDTVFGVALYALDILKELLRIGASQSITARLALRTLCECRITLAYLTKKDSPELWKSYRVFGTGQAKLQLLKNREMDSPPEYVTSETLSILANEDIWEELLPIELRHWEKANLRDLSIEADLKDVYDKFYGWTSTFAHGHWGAVRDAVFDTCANPLHRLHRIPRSATRVLPDAISDACYLVDGVLDSLSSCYPTFSERVTMTDPPAMVSSA